MLFRSMRGKTPTAQPMTIARKCPRVIVSVASYPPRMDYIVESIGTLFAQTRMPDSIQLWLYSGHFPKGLDSLPADLVALREQGLDIRFCDIDLGPHNKYFWTLREHPDDIIITFDDDILYRPDVMETLLQSHERNPGAVCALRAHRMRFDDSGALIPYLQWQFEYMEELDRPRMDLIATGVSGVLYPPRSLESDLMTIGNIKDHCLLADDIWLKLIEVTKNIPVAVCSDFVPTHVAVEGSQTCGLWHAANEGGGNDAVLADVLAHFNDCLPDEGTVLDRIRAGSAS